MLICLVCILNIATVCSGVNVRSLSYNVSCMSEHVYGYLLYVGGTKGGQGWNYRRRGIEGCSTPSSCLQWSIAAYSVESRLVIIDSGKSLPGNTGYPLTPYLRGASCLLE